MYMSFLCVFITPNNLYSLPLEHDVTPKSWTINYTLIIYLSIVVSSVYSRAHSF